MSADLLFLALLLVVVLVGSALCSGVDTLILDESTSNLDTETKKLIYNIISQRKLTIINSTHSQDEIFKYDYEIKISINDGNRNLNLLKN